LSLLELRDVEARYGDVPALRGVTLTVDDGDVVALAGANGAGKTTVLRAISGTVKATGHVVFEGERIHRRTPEGMARRGIAHVRQGRGTFASLSVLDNLRVGAWTRRGQSARDLARVYELFPVLYERRDDRARTLSPAEQQLLALGRALMARPRLLLLDEPSLGLPHELVATLRTLNERGLTMLVVERDATRALEVARHVCELASGRVVSETWRS
jgi:branched-chain amino acid transport system ATP-binding protein